MFYNGKQQKEYKIRKESRKASDEWTLHITKLYHITRGEQPREILNSKTFTTYLGTAASFTNNHFLHLYSNHHTITPVPFNTTIARIYCGKCVDNDVVQERKPNSPLLDSKRRC